MTLSVLIVDDHEQFRTLMRAVFARAGAEVREASNGEAAIAAFDAAPTDVVLMDQTMPGMSGVALAGALRARSNTVRLILASGHKDAALSASAHDAGADAVLVKPISPRTLMETVNALMGAPRAL